METDRPNPINTYGRSKLQGEKYIQDILENYFIIRASWLYSKYGKNFLKTIIKKIKQDERLNIISSQTGTPTSCIDLSKFIFQIITTRNASYGIYNFSAKGNATWYDYALLIAKHFPEYNSSKIIPVKNFASKAARPSYSVLDNTKSQQIMPNQRSWQKSIDEVITHSGQLIG